MLENHSFNQMLGDFQQVYPNLDGIAPAGPRRTNSDDQGQSVAAAAKHESLLSDLLSAMGVSRSGRSLMAVSEPSPSLLPWLLRHFIALVAWRRWTAARLVFG